MVFRWFGWIHFRLLIPSLSAMLIVARSGSSLRVARALSFLNGFGPTCRLSDDVADDIKVSGLHFNALACAATELNLFPQLNF